MVSVRPQKIVRPLIVTAIAVPLALLCWMSAADRMAANSSRLRHSHFGGASAAQAAFGYLAQKDPRAALDQARFAVTTAPIDPQSISALASAELTLGRNQAAYNAFAVAGGLGWRDIPTQLFWLAQALSVGDLGVARDRLDALLRLDVDNDAVTAAIQELEQTPAGQTAFASLLARNPPWEYRVLRGTSALADGAFSGRMAAIDMVASHGVNLDCNAIAGAASDLIAIGRIDDARQLWRHACDRNSDVYLTDGSFENNPVKVTSSPFDWRLQSRGGLDTSIQPAPAPLDGHALRIESSMTVRTVAARQLAVLRPGKYKITWQTARDDGKADDSIDLLVRCNGTTLLDLDRASPAPARPNAVAKTFMVPATGCIIQGIEIQKAASMGGDDETSWVDNVRISPMS